MTAPKASRPVQGQGQARGSAYLTVHEGSYMLAYGATELRMTGWLRNIRDSYAIMPRYRKIAVTPDSPNNAAFTNGTAVVTETQWSQDFDLTTLGAFMFIQPCLGAGVTTGTGGEGYSMFQAWLDTSAEIVGRHSLVLQPNLNSAQIAIVPLGKPFPAFGLSGVMIAVAARGIAGSPTLNLLTRTFTADPTQPGAWDTGTPLLGSNKTFSTTNEDYNSGNLVYAPADVAYAQIGAKIPDVNATGTLDFIHRRQVLRGTRAPRPARAE